MAWLSGVVQGSDSSVKDSKPIIESASSSIVSKDTISSTNVTALRPKTHNVFNLAKEIPSSSSAVSDYELATAKGCEISGVLTLAILIFYYQVPVRSDS